MSSNIEVQRICVFCGNEFAARTTKTLYCSHKCNSRHYKVRQKNAKISESNIETRRARTRNVEDIKTKEFLTVKDAAVLLNMSNPTVYRLIKEGVIKAVAISQRKILIKRSTIDLLFALHEKPIIQEEPIEYEISDCYRAIDVTNKYRISETAVYNLIREHNVPRIKKGWYSYFPKTEIDKILTLQAL